jgi:hypothetical protein
LTYNAHLFYTLRLSLALPATTTAAHATLRLPRLLRNGMVRQRAAPVRKRGAAGEKAVMSFLGKTQEVAWASSPRSRQFDGAMRSAFNGPQAGVTGGSWVALSPETVLRCTAPAARQGALPDIPDFQLFYSFFLHPISSSPPPCPYYERAHSSPFSLPWRSAA